MSNSQTSDDKAWKTPNEVNFDSNVFFSTKGMRRVIAQILFIFNRSFDCSV